MKQDKCVKCGKNEGIYRAQGPGRVCGECVSFGNWNILIEY